jgi:hypothetical protein
MTFHFDPATRTLNVHVTREEHQLLAHRTNGADLLMDIHTEAQRLESEHGNDPAIDIKTHVRE